MLQFTLMWVKGGTDTQLVHSSCCRHGTIQGLKSHIQLQNQLLYPGSGSPSPARPHQIPFPSTCVWVLQAAGRDDGGDIACGPCPRATATGRAAENSTQGWLCCSAQLSLDLGSLCLEVTYFILHARLLHPQASFRDCHANKPTAA